MNMTFNRSTTTTIHECKRCGTCCKNGGPAMHTEDLSLLAEGHLTSENLITIRQGEPVFSPLTNHIEPAAMELIKLTGVGGGWTCCFYQDEDSSCGIYQHRPLECRILKCWDTDELTKVIFKNTIRRTDIIEKDQEIITIITSHEQECSYDKLHRAAKMKQSMAIPARNACREVINQDLAIRQEAIRLFNLSLRQELFYFGRPMFKSLSFFGLVYDK